MATGLRGHSVPPKQHALWHPSSCIMAVWSGWSVRANPTAPTRVPAQVVESHGRGQPQVVHHHLLRLR